MPLDNVMEAAALRETEDALREFVQAAKNIGLKKASLAMMLRNVADEMDPPSILMPGTESVQ